MQTYDGLVELTNKDLERMFKNGTISVDFSNDVNQMLKEWIEDAKILGEKYKVKEYKKLQKFMKNNK